MLIVSCFQPRVHKFSVRTFTTPTKCNQCTSLMIGLVRQGSICEGKSADKPWVECNLREISMWCWYACRKLLNILWISVWRPCVLNDSELLSLFVDSWSLDHNMTLGVFVPFSVSVRLPCVLYRPSTSCLSNTTRSKWVYGNIILGCRFFCLSYESSLSKLRVDAFILVNRRPLGIDPETGIGTAIEGIVKVNRTEFCILVVT